MVAAWHINFDWCMDILQHLHPLVSPRTSSSEVRPCEPCGASCWSLPLLHLYACIYCYRRMHDQLRYCVTPGWCVCDILWDVLWSPWLRADRPCVCDALLRYLVTHPHWYSPLILLSQQEARSCLLPRHISSLMSSVSPASSPGLR